MERSESSHFSPRGVKRITTVKKRVLIVGGGLAGLACAVRLHEAGAQPLILEASDDAGGRVRTDVVDGFRLDRGFQVYLDAYPEAGKLLNLPRLDLRPFKPGALVFLDGRLQRVMDVFRDPRHVLTSALAPVGSLADKLRVAALKWRISRSTLADIRPQCLQGDAVVVAADATTAARFIPGLVTKEPEWRAVTGLYFAAEKSPLREAIIALNGTGRGLVNNVCVLSDVPPGYAPPDRALISISVLGVPAIPDLETQILAELEPWFGPEVRHWRHLRTDRIERALPEQPPIEGALGPCFREVDGLFACGDHLTSASIEGAIISGLLTANALLG
ncbi:MAG: FAD-dependent oxidoreductase [Verrucomicrobiales bacterium]